jgi:spore coat polysaccharide biosynthesis protein SpsF
VILAVLQARLNSSRLPGKALLPLARAPMIVRQIQRVTRSERIDELVVATSAEPADDALATAVRREAVLVRRGPPDDVLARFIGVLDAYPADHVVRLTGDSPLTDPEAIDAVIATHLRTGADYPSNSPPGRACPRGLEVEVITAAALRVAAADASTPQEHGGVTWGFRHDPERWKIAWVSSPPGEAQIGWRVDGPEDYAFVAAVYDELYPRRRAFTTPQLRAFVAERPDLAQFGGVRRV